MYLAAHSASKELESKCLAASSIYMYNNKMQSFKGLYDTPNLPIINLAKKKQLKVAIPIPKFYEKVILPEVEIFGHLTSLVKFSMFNRFLEFLMHSFQPDL